MLGVYSNTHKAIQAMCLVAWCSLVPTRGQQQHAAYTSVGGGFSLPLSHNFTSRWTHNSNRVPDAYQLSKFVYTNTRAHMLV